VRANPLYWGFTEMGVVVLSRCMGYWKTDGFSQTPNAIRIRQKREVDDEFADKMNESKKRFVKKAKTKKVKAKAAAMLGSIKAPHRISRIKHHLSKGRDVADIAVREGWMVSDVLKMIEIATKP
jgi:hypothetical protein